MDGIKNAKIKIIKIIFAIIKKKYSAILIIQQLDYALMNLVKMINALT